MLYTSDGDICTYSNIVFFQFKLQTWVGRTLISPLRNLLQSEPWVGATQPVVLYTRNRGVTYGKLTLVQGS